MIPPWGRSNRCFKSHQRNYITGWVDVTLVVTFKYSPTSLWLQPREFQEAKESGGRGNGSKVCLVQCKDRQSEIKEPPLGSFVFSDERLFEGHWLGLNPPNLSSSQPPSIDTLYLPFPTFAHLTKPGAGGGDPAGGASRCPAPRDEKSSSYTSPPSPALPHSHCTHHSPWQAHLTSLAVFMEGVYK